MSFFGNGSATAKLAIVAEGPSAADNRTTLPFSGPAGDLLDEVLAANDLTRSQIWLTNIIKCRAASLNEGVLKNRPPRASEIKACSKWLDGGTNLSAAFCNFVYGSTRCEGTHSSKFPHY